MPTMTGRSKTIQFIGFLKCLKRSKHMNPVGGWGKPRLFFLSAPYQVSDVPRPPPQHELDFW
jgi:hypothetical protein